MTTSIETTGTATVMERVAGWLAIPGDGQPIRGIVRETEDWPLGAEGWIDTSIMGERP